MQTEAEKYLIAVLKRILKSLTVPIKIINLGAARSVIVENYLEQANLKFICDRTDIEDCAVADKSLDFVGESFVCPMENLAPVPSAVYDVAFANFVLEHITDPMATAREMARIVKPGGQIVLSLSNPQAPEFLLAKITPTSFHQLFREPDHDSAYPIKYAYRSVQNLISLMKGAGLELLEEKRFPAAYSYLYHFPILDKLGLCYDHLLINKDWRALMGHVVLIFRKK